MAKLIEKWKDVFNDTDFRMYQVGHKSHLICAINKKSREYRVSYSIKAGSYFEKSVNVPDGTAHFLEHMLCNPNNLFKTEEDKNLYCLGSIRKPAIKSNASTSFLKIKFYAEGNLKAKKRIHEFFYHTVKYPLKRFDEFLEKERKVILAERSTFQKESQNEMLNLLKYINDNDKYIGCTKEIIGTKESINAIKLEDLIKYYNLAFNQGNICFTVHSSTIPTKNDLKFFDDLAQHFPNKNKINFDKIPEENLDEDYALRYFKKPEERGLQISLFYRTKNYPRKVFKTLSERYIFAHKELLTFKLFDYLVIQKLRNEHSLIYGSEFFSLMINWHWYAYGLSTRCSLENLPIVMQKLYEVIFVESKKFLDSNEGKIWFNSQSQKFIFPLNVEYIPNLAERTAENFLSNYIYKSDYKLWRSVYRNAKIEDIKNHIDTIIYTRMPKVWVMGSENEDKVLNVIKQSELDKNYRKKSKRD